MPDDTTAALQALITQVETLTTTVTDQQKRMDDLHSQNGRLLDQVKDNKRDAATQAASDKKWADMGYERAPDGNYYPKGTTPKHSLTREEARDPQKYRAAKAAAEKAGATLTITDPNKPEDAHHRGRPEVDTSHSTTLVKDDDQRVAYMRRDVMGSDATQYRKLRADGFTVQSWDQPDDLPQHMQAKLVEMEKAHDA